LHEAAGLRTRGRWPPPAGPRVAIVGSRQPSPYGEAVAEQLGADLARAGVIVISGLALGIDAAAHRGALIGGGATVAVMGTGVDIVYDPIGDKVAEESLRCLAWVGRLLILGFLGGGPTNIRSNAIGFATGMGRVAGVVGPVIAGYLLSSRLPLQELAVIIASPYLVVIGACFVLGYRYKTNLVTDGIGEAPMPAEPVSATRS